MGYTTEKGGKIVIWTSKKFVADPYPFHEEGENHTYFFENLKGPHFAACLARESDEVKIKLVAERLKLPAEKIILRSRMSHHKKHSKK